MLPDYSPSPPAPAYSLEPSPDEQRLQLSPRQGRNGTALSSTYIKRLGKATLVLHDQEDDVQIPSYERNSIIRGSLCFDDPANITDVVVKIRGSIETTLTEFGAKTRRIINDSYTLWKTTDATHSACPNQLAFFCPLPSSYVEDREDKQLPPSFHHFIPGFYVKIYYYISVEVIRTRRWKVDFWPSVQRDCVPFNYSPRSRANRPIVDMPNFLRCIKILPEEWHQATSTLKTRPYWQPGRTREPLYCHFFVPSVRVFGVSDTIPFHIQLNGPISSLCEFFPPDALHRIASSDSSLSALSSITTDKSSRAAKASQALQPCVRVLVIRQVVVDRGGNKVWRNSNIGQGVVQPLPPPHIRDRCLGTREESLDWTGHIKCNEDVEVGSFTTNSVHIQHFISLIFTPPDPRKSPFIELTINIPIKLVSDSYSETG